MPCNIAGGRATSPEAVRAVHMRLHDENQEGAGLYPGFGQVPFQQTEARQGSRLRRRLPGEKEDGHLWLAGFDAATGDVRGSEHEQENLSAWSESSDDEHDRSQESSDTVGSSSLDGGSPGSSEDLQRRPNGGHLFSRFR